MGETLLPVDATSGRRRPTLGRRRSILLVVCLVAGLVAPAGAAAAADPCDPATFSAVGCENTLPGTPPSQWEVNGAGASTIQGFASGFSVDQGETVDFKVATAVADYRVDIYRTGWYGGDGARLVTTVEPSAPLPQSQPACLTEQATGLVDCGNWAVSASWQVPADAVSGIYLARLVAEDGSGDASHVTFVVRDDDGGADLLFQTADTTWQAYNEYGGNSLYTGQPDGRAYKVSYNRPFTTADDNPEDWYFNAEYPMVRWLERNGYDVSYTTGIDTDLRGGELLEHRAFLSVGHDEYWSAAQRSNVEAARDAGVHLAFFSGNEVFWKTRWEPSIDGSGDTHRTLVTYKETKAGEKIDPSPEWTGTWRDPLVSPPSDGGRPENELTGQLFMVNGYRADPMDVSAREGQHRFWRDTAIANLAPGGSVRLPDGILGYEWDEDIDNGFRPAGLQRLSTTVVDGVPRLQDQGNTYFTDTATHHLTLYRAASGALVFGAGTVQWSWGLDDDHLFAGPPTDVNVRQATVNLFADMGVQPVTLADDLVAASPSTDTTPPAIAIESPADGATLTAGQPATVSGTATDADGVVAAVEVSTDGGTTWHPANGLDQWQRGWTPTTDTDVLVRAADDSGNLAQASVSVTMDGASTPDCCTLFGPDDTAATAAENDVSAVTLGMKFRADTDGVVTALRFLKSASNDGPHTGTLWTATGDLLAETTFTDETTSGWQRQDLPTAVPITAGQLYVVAYHAPNGRYSVTPDGFGTAVTRGPLTAPSTTEVGGNGVYAYGPAGQFPGSSWNASNYFVDVEFSDAVVPTVTDRSPAPGATGVAASTTVGVTWSSPVVADQLTMTVTGDGAVDGAVTYDEATRSATFTPNAALAPDTVHTVVVSGVTDPSGTALPDEQWAFTTEGVDTTPPTVTGTTPADGAVGFPVTGAMTVGFDEPVDPATASATLTAAGAAVAVTVAGSPDGTAVTITPDQPLAASTEHVLDVVGTADQAGNVSTDVRVTFTTGDEFGCPCSLLDPGATPTADPDQSAVELGMRFRTSVDGYVTALRFYKPAAAAGTDQVGSLWSADGALLASAPFTSQSGVGWQQVTLGSPVAVTAGSDYVVSYFAPAGRYAVELDGFAGAVASGPLAAPADGDGGGNGVYRYGGGFPTSSYRASNYFADVVFGTDADDTSAPQLVSTTPVDGQADIRVGTVVRARFDEPVAPDGVTLTVMGPDGAVPGAVDVAGSTVTFTPDAALAGAAVHDVALTGVADAAGNAAADVAWTFTTRPADAVCPCQLFDDTDTPVIASNDDDNAVEVGVRVTPSIDGFLTHVRFHKGAGNTGTHEGHVWSVGGDLLGVARFTDETATGWQQAPLAAPVPVTAGETVVVSYHAPNGGYSLDLDGFAQDLDVPGMVAPAGNNGLYTYGPNGSFPTSTFRASNYWVDVVLAETAQDSVAPTVVGRTPEDGATGVATSSRVTLTTSEPIDATSLDVVVTDGGTAVAGQVEIAGTTMTWTPDGALAELVRYDVAVTGIRDPAGNTAPDQAWGFTTAGPPPPGPEVGPGGPIAVVTDPARPFGTYLTEILRAEGLNAFTTLTDADLTSAGLAPHSTVVLAEMPLDAAQVGALEDWVTAGGNLVAMRPADALGPLLGLAPTGGTLQDAYLEVDTTSAPGAGIVGETIQFHGTADRWDVTDARVVATLYGSATTSTGDPAVTVRDVGTAGGQAAAFTYDLAWSVVTTRQGNPAWAGEDRDGLSPHRSNDLFFGGATDPDWVDLDKVAIPQADEQQRLMANLLTEMSSDVLPLPRFWYFPRGERAVVVATGDDHANNGTPGRYDRYDQLSPAGCDVEVWECLRFTSYIYDTTPFNEDDAATWDGLGFETALHLNTGCGNFTPASLRDDFTTQLASFSAGLPGVGTPRTNRTHCIVWSDWATKAQVSAENGVRLDTNYYYFPGSWVQDRPGFMTGSGLPMRFADLDGTMIDAYQATTQMTDESGQSYPFTPATLLDRALGAEGYYGAFVANMHTDLATIPEDDALTSAALSRGVPVITAEQLLDWTDGRNLSSFDDLTFDGGVLSFGITRDGRARGLTTMLPMQGPTGQLSQLTRDGSPVTWSTETIKGVAHAVFDAAPGAHVATYGG